MFRPESLCGIHSSSKRVIQRSQLCQRAANSGHCTFTQDSAVSLSKRFCACFQQLSSAIHNVTVGGYPSTFSHHDPLANISMGGHAEVQDCHRHPELKRKIYSALQESDEGELSIAIPTEVPLKQSAHLSSGLLYGRDGAFLI